ncbi:MAG TPA: class I SAM-dependent methyltransferase [Polyangiaceae bacterium]|nr:class I SAM-dependent methyltransferase [Polyangiaceae bacterium]
MKSQLTNILRNATRPGYLVTMAQKVMLRADDYLRRSDPREVRKWCAGRAESVEVYAQARSPALWDEAASFTERFRVEATRKLHELGVTLGGGGHYELLYFLARWKKPALVLETGVAAGFSSAAILSALERNQLGQLKSSDFPYFRLERPERFIGCLVEERLKSRWHLETKGDRLNLPKLLRGVQQIDLFHYDSDKSHYGRRSALSQVGPKLSERAVLLMDDVQDNWFFREYVETTLTPFRIFEFEGKYLGLVERGS